MAKQKVSLKNIVTYRDDPDLQAFVWKAAASYYGSIQGKLIGPRNIKAEIISLIDEEAQRILYEHRRVK